MSETSRPTIIYALVDPRSSEVRYVGKTQRSLAARIRQHLWRKNLTPRRHSSCWLAGLVADGLSPKPLVLEEVPEDGDWQAAERKWIAHYRESGARLTNLTDGGEGVAGYRMPAERRQQLSEALKGRVFDEEWRRNISKATKGRSKGAPAPEAEAKRQASHRQTYLDRAVKKTHCRKGHELTGDNLVQVSPTRKVCRACQKAAARLKYLRSRPPLKTPDEIRAKRIEVAARPETKEAQAASAKLKWQDPEFRASQAPRLAAMSKSAGEKTAFKAGEDHPGRKLTWDAVDDIRCRVAAGESRRLVAGDHGVALTTVDQIVQGRCWDPATRPA